MPRLPSLLLGLLRRLLSSPFVTGSIKRLLFLIQAIQRLFSKRIPPRRKDTLHTLTSTRSRESHIDGFTVGDVICPSLQPPPRAIDSNYLHASYDHDEQYMAQPIHSPTPLKGYILPYANGPHGSQSSQDIGTLSPTERNPDTFSISSRRSAKSSSALSLPISHHGLVRISSRPDSYNSSRPNLLRPNSRNSHRPNSQLSQPIKVSRPPTPALANMAQPAGAVPLGCSRPGSPLPLRTLLPMSTATIQRWTRNISVSTKITYCIVEPLKFTFDDDNIPRGWTVYASPEGGRYFFHEEKRIYTDANLCDPEERVVITESADQILGDLANKARDENIILPSDVELVLEIVPQKNDFDAEAICEDIKVVVSLSHLRHEIESQYWAHWELFPNTREVTPDIVQELRDIVLQSAVDIATSRTSNAVWSTEQNRAILNLAHQISTRPGKPNAYSAWVIGRTMRNITHNRFIHLHGQRGARLDRDQSVHGSIVNPRTLLVTSLSPLLFWAPDVHLRSLEKIWVDRLVHIGPWIQFIDKLNTEWQEFSIIATVLLNANVAFLSIQSVDNGGNVVADRSAAQIASYISIVTSIGSVIISLLLVRQNRTKNRQNAEEAATFLGKMTHETRGLETLAILYALPYALLMWSTLSFLAAFLIACFFFSSSVTRSLVGGSLVAVSVLVVWCIITAWTYKFNITRLQLPLSAHWDKCKVILHRFMAHYFESNERKESSETPTYRGDSPSDDEKQGGKRQQSWSRLMIFVRKSTGDPPIRVNSDGGEKSEA